MIGNHLLDRDFALRNRCIRAGLVADLPVEDMVVMLALAVGAFCLAAEIFAQFRRVCLHRLERIDENGKLFILDFNEFARVGGDVAVLGDNESNFLILEQNLAVSQNHLHVARERRHPVELDGLQVFGSQDGDDALDGSGLARIDRFDPGVCIRRPDEIAEQHARQFDVIDILAFALREADILHPLAAATHALKFFCALFARNGYVVHSAAS